MKRILVVLTAVIFLTNGHSLSSSEEDQIEPLCEVPETLEKGSIGFEEAHFVDNDIRFVVPGSGLKFNCFSGYRLVGSSHVVCKSNGFWESPIPKCYRRWCPSPPPVDNGIWLGRRQAVGSTKRLRCQAGYVIEEQQFQRINCVRVNETELTWDWTGAFPACRKLAVCPDPGMPVEGTGTRMIQGSRYFYEDTEVTIECSEGYDLVGEETIVCQNDSQWSFSRGRCKPNVTCDDIEVGKYAILTVAPNPRVADFYVPGDTLYLHCQPGFMANTSTGLLDIYCDSEGQWEGPLATCTGTLCHPPVPPKNGYLMEEDKREMYEQEEEVRIRCLPGYRLFGYNWNRCTNTGWLHDAPRCSEVTCRDPGFLDKGNSHGPSKPYRVNATVTFSCYDGYTLHGSESRTCMSNGQWDGQLATCNSDNYDGCPTPGVPINGFIVKTKSSGYYPGDVVQFDCDAEYLPQGSKKITCQSNNQWDGQELLCRGFSDIDRPQDIKIKLLNELDTKLTIQDSERSHSLSVEGDVNSAMAGKILDTSIRNSGGHLVFYFVFDSSNSVGKDNFQTSIKFANALIRRVMTSSNVHVGLVTYGKTARIDLFPLNNTMKIVTEKLSKLTYIGGGTGTKDALEKVLNMVVTVKQKVTGAIKSVVFLVTDGFHNEGGNPEEKAKTLKDLGLEIFVIGLLGNRKANPRGLYRIASSEKHVLYTSGYETLEYLVDHLLHNKIDYTHCGISVRNVSKDDMKGRIIGGHGVVIHWPWMADIQSAKRPNGFCGGSVIDNMWILTAAHCLVNVTHPANLTVKIGALSRISEDGDPQLKSVESIWKHPKYFPHNYDYDVALLKLKTPIIYGKYVRRVCLPPDFADISDNSTLYQPNKEATVIGYGVTETQTSSDDLKEVNILIQDKNTCLNSIEGKDAEMTDNMICAGVLGGGKDACEGDSGGPLMQELGGGSMVNEPYWVQVGIVSWGIKDQCGNEGFYGFYTHVAKVKSWIMSTITSR